MIPSSVFTIKKFVKEFDRVVCFLSYLNASSRFFPSLYLEQYFKWKIFSNPHGESGCYLRYKDSAPVAHCSITAKPMNQWLMRDTGLGELGDTHTHPDYQKQGHFGVLGSHVIKEFDELKSYENKLIYGLPNDNALPGWLSRCNCEVSQNFGIIELIRKIEKNPISIFMKTIKLLKRKIIFSTTNLQMCTNNNDISKEIDLLWDRCNDKNTFLLKKDGIWWKWRYIHSSEDYVTYTLRENDSERLMAYMVVKIKRFYIYRNISICDIFGVTSEHVIKLFRLFVSTAVTPLDNVVFWAQSGTELAEAAVKNGFIIKRNVPIIFYKNDASLNLKQIGFRIKFSLGDSDNV